MKKQKKKKLNYGGNAEYQQSQAQANGIVGIVGKINPIIGLGLKAGQAIGKTTMDENGIYKSKAGQFIDNSINPTTGIQNLKDVIKKPTASNIANQLTLGLVGKGATQKKRLAQKQQQEFQQQAEWRMQNTPDSTIPTFKHGGRLDNADVVQGGEVQAISPDAVQVKANNPTQTDSVELDQAFVDHNEVIDNQDRVFSDSLKMPSGRTIAKEAARLEKMKSKQSRFNAANAHIDRKLDDLFNYQESQKVAMNNGGKLPKPTVQSDATTTSVNKGFNRMDWKVPDDYTMLDAATQKPLPSNIMLDKNLAQARRELVDGSRLNLNKLLNEPVTKQQMKKGGKMGYFGGGPLDEIPTFKYGFNAKDTYNPYTDKMQQPLSVDTGQLTNPITNLAKSNLNKRINATANAGKGFNSMGTGNKWGNIGATAGQFGSDIVNAFLVSKQAKPKAPTREKSVFLDRINANAQLAENARVTTNTNELIRRTTSQAGQALGNMGSTLAKRLSADNQVRQNVNNANAQIQAQEAGMNANINARNVANENQFKADQVAAKNQKLSQYSQIAANVGQKAMQMRQEKQRKEYDRAYLDILRQKYNDSGLNDRFVDMIMKKYEDEAYKKGTFRYGGKMPRGKKKC